MYEIRLCKASEIALLTDFLKNSWSQNHIFVKDRNLLNFQHQTIDGYNFVVAYHSETNRFHGVLGVVSPGFYTDRKIHKNQDVWLVIWKVDKNLAESKSLGLDMLDYVEAEFSPKTVSAIGIDDEVGLLYKLLGFKTKTMNQWFIPNKDIVDSKLIKGDLPSLSRESGGAAHSLVKCGIEQENELQIFLSKNKSKRTFKYLVERYLNHPSYKYCIYAIINASSSIHAVIVGRKVMANGASAFRLTELFHGHGSVLDLSTSLNKMMALNGYEYIDFVEYGFNAQCLLDCGFIECSENLFVPHLFEPFFPERYNVKIAFKSKQPFSCTKGDSDLDRPNQEETNV